MLCRNSDNDFKPQPPESVDVRFCWWRSTAPDTIAVDVGGIRVSDDGGINMPFGVYMKTCM